MLAAIRAYVSTQGGRVVFTTTFMVLAVGVFTTGQIRCEAMPRLGPDRPWPGLQVQSTSPGNIDVQRPSAAGTTWRRFGTGLGLTFIVSFAAVAWVAVLRKQVRDQTVLIRKQVAQEAALEERYRELVQNANDIVYSHDLSGTLTAFNTAGEKITGFSPAEVITMNIAQLVAPDQLERARDMIARKIRGEAITTYELDIITKSGPRRTLEISSRPILVQGKAVGVQGIARDVTDRKKSDFQKAAFLTLGQRLSSASRPEAAARIIGEVADSLLGWDACTVDLYSASEDKIYSLLNVDIVGGKRVDVVPVYVGIPPTHYARSVLDNGPLIILRQGRIEISPEAVPFGDVTRTSASLLFAQIRNGLKINGVLSIQSYSQNAYTKADLDTLQSLADLCGGALERIRTVEALAQSEQKFRQLVEQAADAFFVCSTDGRFVDVNQRACESLGYTRAELLSHAISDVDVRFASERRADVWRTLALGHAITLEGSHRRKDGTVFPVEVRLGMIESGGDRLILALARDITERLNLEAQLRHAQKLESVGQLAAGVAHDFNNILTIIQGYTALLQGDGGAAPEQTEALMQISAAAERAANLTQQLLAFSRRQLLQPAPLDLNEVIPNMFQILEHAVGEQIVIRFSPAARLPLVQADLGMIEQIIMNLAFNARDAMPKGGELSIATEVVRIEAIHVKRNAEAVLGEHVCLTVTDTGTGMDAATLDKLFEPFFTTKEVGKGTGLGLATVYGVVKQHRGWIEVDSKPERGSTFKVFFPATGGAERAPQEQPEQSRPLSGTETILLVEDEAALRALSCRVLQDYGYRVLTAQSGIEALTIWREHNDSIDLLVSGRIKVYHLGSLQSVPPWRELFNGLRDAFSSFVLLPAELRAAS